MTKTMPQTVKSALENLIAAKAAWETTDEIDRRTKAAILAQNEFFEEETGKRITESNADFLMSTADFTDYIKLVYAENCRKGIDSGGWDLTFWPVQKAMIDAENAYIDAIAAQIPEYTPEVVDKIKHSPKHRDEFFKITFNALILDSSRK